MNNAKESARTNEYKRDTSESDLVVRSSIPEKKRTPHQPIDKRQDLYDPEIVPNSRERDHSQSRSNRTGFLGVKKLKNIDNEILNNGQGNRNSKSILKLPHINSKAAIPKKKEDRDTAMTSSTDKNTTKEKYINNYNGKTQDFSEKKILGPEIDQKTEDLAVNFLTYINVKPIKPSDRSPEKNLDRSMRDLRLNKLEQSIKLDMKKTKHSGSLRKALKSETKPTEEESKEPKSEKAVSDVIEQMQQRQKKTFSITHKTSNPQSSSTVMILERKKKIRTSYQDFCLFISLMNRVSKPEEPTATYKAFVGKGNNSVMVKNVIKNRFWWNIVSQPDGDCNLSWTQGRNNKLIHSFRKGQENGKKIKTRAKLTFLLKEPSKDEGRVSLFRESARVGLSKLLSSDERGTIAKNDYCVEIPSGQYVELQNPNRVRMHNHVEFNWNLCNKKALFHNMRAYYMAINQDPFQYIPLTFHIRSSDGEQWDHFERAFNERQKQIREKKDSKGKKTKNMWIVKPGENSNQGNGIEVSDSLEEILQMVKAKESPNRSLIVQKYIMPFLYSKRKFDIRCYMVVTSVNSVLKAYWYEEGYIRTSSKEFTVKDIKNKLVHLTNDAIQKKSEDYGKFQYANKISFADFQRFLDNTHPQKNLNFYEQVYPQMIKLAADAVKSTLLLLDANKREFTFEVFGLDFMVDQEFRTWLIQVNNNPCLGLSSPLLARLIPNMLENAFRIAVDPFFPPPSDHLKSKTVPSELFQANKFTLIFSSLDEGQHLQKVLNNVQLLEEECQEDPESDNVDEVQ